MSGEQIQLNTVGHLPFASELEDEQCAPLPQVVECVATTAKAVELPVQHALRPSIFAQPKEEFLEHHARSARPAPQYAPVEMQASAPDEVGVEADSESGSATPKERTLLGYLSGLLPGASAPRTWRPVGTLVVMLLILFLGWHVVNGKDGISVWQQKRAEERRLQQEVDHLQQENAQVKTHIDELNTSKDAIEREAREKLHYARQGEIIYTLPEKPPAPDAAE